MQLTQFNASTTGNPFWRGSYLEFVYGRVWGALIGVKARLFAHLCTHTALIYSSGQSCVVVSQMCLVYDC